MLILTGASFLQQPQLLAASKETAAPKRSTHLELNVRVYAGPKMSEWSLTSAEKETERILRFVHLNFHWLNCQPPSPPSCFSPQTPIDLMVRIVPNALQNVSSEAVGAAAWSNGTGAAFIFYDRVLKLLRPSIIVSDILGKVLAHEILHLLLPMQAHADRGLLTAQWSPEMLGRWNREGLGLSNDLIRQVQASVVRLTSSANNQQSARNRMGLINKSRP